MIRSVVIADEPTPEPSSSVTTSSGSDGMGRSDAPLAYFEAPTPAALALEAAIRAAYDEGRTLYGDEDGDAWLAALENGTHPLCRISSIKAPASPQG